jgi:predicted nucleic acid-binding protein
VTYWDTSCVIKLYAPEPDSRVYVAKADTSDAPLVSSALLEVEVCYALHRKEAAEDIKPGSANRLLDTFRSDVAKGRLTLVPFNSDVRNRSVEIARLCYAHEPPVLLRSLDGIHLATALVAKASPLLTTDRRMIAAANALGVNVLDVERAHPFPGTGPGSPDSV